MSRSPLFIRVYLFFFFFFTKDEVSPRPSTTLTGTNVSRVHVSTVLYLEYYPWQVFDKFQSSGTDKTCTCLGGEGLSTTAIDVHIGTLSYKWSRK